MRLKSGLAVVLGLVSTATLAFPCQRMTPISLEEMIRESDAIVRATAVDYAIPPDVAKGWTSGVPDARVRFQIVELLRGSMAPPEIALPGYLSEQNDFNDRPVPFDFVRPGGRAGSCFANTYRAGAQFLLFLKHRDGAYTVNWYGLGPVNEQLRSDRDPWLLWTREQVTRAK